MARRRRFQWIDALVSSPIAVAGAAAPGTISNQTIISEVELENVGGGATMMRVVGDIILRATAGNPVFTYALWVFPAYVGSVQPTDWDNDTFQRADMLGTWTVQAPVADRISIVRVDLRTKRKLGQGVQVQLAIQNHSIAGNDASIAFHLRSLLLLP